ncbi:MAG: ATP synthase F1 subunit delta [Cytophagales bacterium]|nr:ATP synthase F1 subunit delta [Cytophagales bacterium]
MSEYRVASAYAKSLIDLSMQQNVLDQIHNDMVLAARVCSQSRELRNLLSSPIVHIYKKLEIVKQIFEHKVHTLSFQFFILITKKGRDRYLYAIVNEFISQYRKIQGLETLTVTTAVKIDKKLQNSILDAVKNISDKKLEINTKVDPSILGGFLVNAGGRQLDASVRKKLNDYKKGIIK